MCGVFGYIGKKDPLNKCLSALQQLEYRGYDSSGIGGIFEGKIVCCKKAGKLELLKKEISLPPLEIAIAHTRWATHGKVSDQNAHPHLDASESIALIHNGSIENYDVLLAEIEKEGIKLRSETDTEVIAELLAKYYEGDLVAALQKTTARLKGIFALVAIHKDHPHELVVAARGCPLSIGFNDDKTEAMVSSDPSAFHDPELNILFLEKSEIARVTKNGVEIFDQNLKQVNKASKKLAGESAPPSKGHFKHYMLKEIYEQPSAIKRALQAPLQIPDDFFEHIDRIWLIGCGTSANAGSLAALLFEEIAHISATCEIASEACYRTTLLTKQTLVIAISQSGETADTLAALREVKKAGCKTLALCNVAHSTLMREADHGLLLHAGPEISVCSTKAFTSMLTVLTLLVLELAKKRRLPYEHLLTALQKIPDQVQQVIDQADSLKKLAHKYLDYDDFFFMGRRYMFPTAVESALKLKEISYVNANGYLGGELKHGPIALLHSRFPVVAFTANQQTQEKMFSNLMTVKARGAPVFAIGAQAQQNIGAIANDIFYVPDTLDELAPFASTVAGQLFAYFIAEERGCDVDQPHHLAKSVTVA
jgi:glucosamine--fructose-6-phosphate aminotransferase (isomerizing)